MTSNTNLADQIITSLNGSGLFNDCKIIKSFTNRSKPTPITTPLIAVSVKGCKISPRITEQNASGDPVETKKRTVLSTVAADIYLPYSASGSTAHTIFDKIATYLIFTKAYSITESSFGELSYDSSCQAIVLHGAFTFESIVSA